MTIFSTIQQCLETVPTGYILAAKVALILLTTLIVQIVWKIVYRRLIPHFDKSKTIWDDVVAHAADKPIILLIWLTGITYAVDIIRNTFKEDALNTIDTIWRIGLIVCIGWFIKRFIKLVAERIVQPGYREDPIDQSTVDAIKKVLLITLYAILTLIILQELNIQVSAILAFGGGGALIVGLAAKDLIANFFGGLMVYLDRPFAIGDWIDLPDKHIEGTVEYIGWRSTRIRTFDMRPLYVPNAIFSTVSIQNPSRMTNRRISTTIGVRYKDAKKVSVIVKDIEEMLKNHPDIDTRKTLMVSLIGLGNSSLDIMIYAFTKTTQWVKFQTVQEDVLLKIVDLIYDKHHAEISPPTYGIDMRGGLPSEIKEYFKTPCHDKEKINE